MSTRNIHHSKLPDKPVCKADKTKGSAGTEVSKSPGRENIPDSVRVSGKPFARDMDFAKSVMASLNEKQIDTLQKIRKNIDKGMYDKDDIQEKIRTRIQRSQFSLESFMISALESADPADKPYVTENQLRL